MLEANGVREGGAFFESVGDGLLEVDIFAGGVNRHADVPVVGRCDDDGVDISGEHLVIIDVGGGEAARAHLHCVATRAVDVADGDELDGAEFFSGIEQGVHTATGTDDSDAKRVVGAEDAGRGEGG